MRECMRAYVAGNARERFREIETSGSRPSALSPLVPSSPRRLTSAPVRDLSRWLPRGTFEEAPGTADSE